VTASALPRRRSYTTTSIAPQERFIVPLLAAAIDDELARLAPSRRGARALDVGCGESPLRDRLEAAGWEYVGLDLTQNHQGTVDVVAAIDGPLPSDLQPDSFELVVCTEVLEHVADWTAAFTNLAALLAPGGHLVLTAPHVFPLHEEPHDYWRPTLHALRRFAADADLVEVRVTAAGDGWDVLGTVLGGLSLTRRSGTATGALATAAAKAVRRTALAVLASPRWRDGVATGDGIYLSNVGVFRRPS
jgi:SAM-dependent methyltransferase